MNQKDPEGAPAVNAHGTRTRTRWWAWGWMTHGSQTKFPQYHYVTIILICQVIYFVGGNICAFVLLIGMRFTPRPRMTGIIECPSRLDQLRLLRRWLRRADSLI